MNLVCKNSSGLHNAHTQNYNVGKIQCSFNDNDVLTRLIDDNEIVSDHHCADHKHHYHS